MKWTAIEEQLPPLQKHVMTKIDDANGVRNEQVLYRDGRLYFTDKMYVYYTPTHWRELTLEERIERANRK